MKTKTLTTALLIFTALLPLKSLAGCPEFLNYDMRKLHSSESLNLCDAIGNKPALVVNTASHCGFTPQFKGLEALHQRYAKSGLVVVGFASDDFRQAAKSEEEAATICYKNYGVSFLMLAPSHVRGENANPLFQEVARQSTSPRWNFNKYLLDANGKVVQHFPSSTKPDSPVIQAAIESLL